MKVTIIKIYKKKKLIATISLQDNVIVIKGEVEGIQSEVETSSIPMFDTKYKITDYKLIKNP